MIKDDGMPVWYWCPKHNHMWVDELQLDNGQPTGKNGGVKECSQ